MTRGGAPDAGARPMRFTYFSYAATTSEVWGGYDVLRSEARPTTTVEW
jgi:hypothetical protein